MAASASEPSGGGGVPIAPVILGGVGVALLGTSLTLGLMSNASHDNYDDTPVTDDDSAQAALDELHTAEAQATAANVTLGLGLGALVAGGVWLIWQLKDSGTEPRASLRPHVAKGELGLTFSAPWSDEL